LPGSSGRLVRSMMKLIIYSSEPFEAKGSADY
jgi:hypothetical protein